MLGKPLKVTIESSPAVRQPRFQIFDGTLTAFTYDDF